MADIYDITEVVQELPYDSPSKWPDSPRLLAANSFADHLAAKNPDFDRVAFLRECGVEESSAPASGTLTSIRPISCDVSVGPSPSQELVIRINGRYANAGWMAAVAHSLRGGGHGLQPGMRYEVAIETTTVDGYPSVATAAAWIAEQLDRGDEIFS